ncbi:MAG: hypothetical protein QXU32_01845 [Nitrososphaerales archaeon]
MPTNAIQLGAVPIGTSETVILTVPSGTEYNIPVIRLTNSDTSNHTVTIYNYDPSSESASDITAEINTFTIQPKTTFEFGPLILPPGRKISAVADVANKIFARAHGWSTTP